MIEILKTINKRLFQEHTSAIQRNMNISISFNWISKTLRNLLMTMIFINVKKIVDDIYYIKRMLSMEANLLILFSQSFDDFVENLSQSPCFLPASGFHVYNQVTSDLQWTILQFLSYLFIPPIIYSNRLWARRIALNSRCKQKR